MDDNTIISLFWSRDETAINETKLKYGSRLHSLAMNILHDSEDSDEILNDTFFAALETIPPAKPDRLFSYLAKLCRYKAYSRLDFKTAKKRSAQTIELTAEMEACLPSPEIISVSDKELVELINRFLAELTQEKRMIFVRKYWFNDTVKDISVRYKVSESKVKVTLHRTRKELDEYIKKDGF